MTDKQIADGVDVSGCEFCDWKGSDIPQCRIRQASFEPTCKGYNCYYKQLKRKEQECYKYKQALDEIENYCKECNLKADFTACEILDIINKIKGKK